MDFFGTQLAMRFFFYPSFFFITVLLRKAITLMRSCIILDSLNPIFFSRSILTMIHLSIPLITAYRSFSLRKRVFSFHIKYLSRLSDALVRISRLLYLIVQRLPSFWCAKWVLPVIMFLTINKIRTGRVGDYDRWWF